MIPTIVLLLAMQAPQQAQFPNGKHYFSDLVQDDDNTCRLPDNTFELDSIKQIAVSSCADVADYVLREGIKSLAKLPDDNVDLLLRIEDNCKAILSYQDEIENSYHP